MSGPTGFAAIKMKSMGESQFFSQTPPKMDQIQKQLDGDSQSEKLEAMKRLIAMVSKGKDVAQMFPQVVKNVVSPSLEIKKLVYMFLIHFAEEKPDEALLSISHFQRDMGDKNQFIRASALRVLSSIRVPLIVQIVMIAIRKCATDSSPYVRKVAAIAIPKVFSLNEDEKDQLIVIIEQLLGDNNTIVLGAAVFAFTEVCPDRYDLLHRHFRKMCRLMVDCDEWGQALIINVLLRYARTQFLSPFNEGYKMKVSFYSKADAEDDDSSTSSREDHNADYDMDADHRMLLRSALPLLQSRNSATVLNVASLYFHIAPPAEFSTVVKSLMRICRGSREQEYCILHCIQAMAADRPEVFQPYLKDFFVKWNDAGFLRDLKLNIMAVLATEANVPAILKEFRTYIRHTDKAFVRAAIRAIGKVASGIPEVADACLSDLLALISNKQEEVVAESVIIIRHLIQKQAMDHPSIIKKLAKLLDTITVPIARASIIWLVGEFQQLIPQLAPDILRKLAKTFITEANVAKLQIITLGTKLYLADNDANVASRIAEIFQYVLQVARYDTDYDIRDRTRVTKALLFGTRDSGDALRSRVKDILLGEKLPPQFGGNLHTEVRYQLGSMSHMVNHNAYAYTPLPDFPTEMPDADVRDVVDDSGFHYQDDTSTDSNSDDDSEGSADGSEESEDHKRAPRGGRRDDDSSDDASSSDAASSSAAGSGDDDDDDDDDGTSSSGSGSTSS